MPSDLSAKIVSTFNIFPISYPITIPPIAGDKIMSILPKFSLILLAREWHMIFALLGTRANDL